LDRALGEIVAEGGSVSEIAKNKTAVDLATLAERIL
jgi:hypothetical protein